jgi:predicted DNA-binding transcriptional regulator AlpA
MPEFFENLPESLSRADLARAFGVSETTITRWAASGKIPAPIRLTRKTVRWSKQAVIATLPSDGAV